MYGSLARLPLLRLLDGQDDPILRLQAVLEGQGEAVRRHTALTAVVAGRHIAVHDLTAIRGIGIVMQDRLNRAGIRKYAQLAEAKPEHVREALGKSSRGAKIEAWISQAQELAARK